MRSSKFLFVSIILMKCVHLNTQQINEECSLGNGTKGICLGIRNCPSAIVLIRNRIKPPTCGFEGKVPIVCCENNSTGLRPSSLQSQPGRLSRQKCNHYYIDFSSKIAPRPIYVVIDEKPGRLRVKRADITTKAPIGIMNEDDLVFHHSVAGGQNADAAKYIHMVALGYGSLSNPTWGCGGSLVSEKFVLTAAHCIESKVLGRVQFVRMGDLDLKIDTDDAKPQTVMVSRTIVHPSYRPPLVYHDIALIELKENANFNNFVRPACLHSETNIVDKTWIATGWGSTSFLGDAADHLQDVILREFSFEQCQIAYRGESPRRLNRGIDDNSQICAGESNKDTCQGDSGGPLQVANANASIGYTLIGVTSFGKACAIGSAPAVYTRVSHYISWIETTVWPNEYTL